jgi:hypothetical protein
LLQDYELWAAVLFAISEAGLTLAVSKTQDTLEVYPAENITPELATAIKKHKADITCIMREDVEMQRTGIIQSERQVFELAREHFRTNDKGGQHEAWELNPSKVVRPEGGAD